MGNADSNKYRELLEQKKADLMARVRAARSDDQDADEEEAPDLGDRALSTMSRDLKFELTGTERNLLRRIQEALERIAAGGFGECQNCGKKVQPGRLEAVPWARHCIDCQELQDRGEI
jgi:DnaK suppressor protein